ncbi:MAG: MarR family transcriptional regulator [Terriglobales bacterium]
MLKGHGSADSQPAGETEQERVYVALLRTAYRLEGEVAARLKPHELTPTQYNALRILRGAGAEGLPCSEVGARMINRDPDITRLVDRLEKRGLVTRRRGKADRRVIRAAIAPAGLNLLKGLDEPVRNFLRQRMGHLATERLHLLSQLLEQARTGLPG